MLCGDPLPFFKALKINMLMTVENGYTDLPLLGLLGFLADAGDLPPIGFCNEFLLGSEGCAQLNFLYYQQEFLFASGCHLSSLKPNNA